MADKINDSILSVQLRTIVSDVEHRMPNLREPDPLSDWGAGVAWMLDRLSNIANDNARGPQPMTAVAQHPLQTLDRAIAQLRERFPNGPVNAWTAGWLSAAAEIAGEPWEEASSTRETVIRLENHQQLVNTLSAAELSVYGSQRAYDTSALLDHPARLNRLITYLQSQLSATRAQLDTANGGNEARSQKIVAVSKVLALYWSKYAPDGAATDYDLPEQAQRLLHAADISWQRMKDSRDQLSQRATELDRELAEARREPPNVESLSRRLEDAKARTLRLERERDTLDERVRLAESRHGTLTCADVEVLSAHLADSVGPLIDGLRPMITNKSFDADEVGRLLEPVRTHHRRYLDTNVSGEPVSELKKQLSAVQSDFSDVATQRDRAREERDELRTQVESLTRMNNSLTEDANEATNARWAAVHASADLERERNQLKAALANEKSRVEQLEREKNECSESPDSRDI